MKVLGRDLLVVAEIGKNFIQTPEDEPVEEYLVKAKALVDAAAAAGADAVKFQTHEVEDEQANLHVVSSHFKGDDRYHWVKRNTEATPLEEFWRPLKAHCDERGIIFFSTPMSRQAARKLNQLDVPFWKVGSGDVQDYVLLDYLAGTGKSIIISTGMVSLVELDEVVGYLRQKQVPVAILYCVSQYPCPPETFNLGTIEYLREKYPEATVGFSDHSVGDEAAQAAVKLGAKIVEKHFSFSRNLWGADHKVSMLPAEMGELVSAVRQRRHLAVDASRFYGEKTRELEGADNQYRPYFNRSLCAAADLPSGAVLTKEAVYSLRPRLYLDGLPAHSFEKVLGKRLKRGLKKYEPIKEENLFRHHE